MRLSLLSFRLLASFLVLLSCQKESEKERVSADGGESYSFYASFEDGKAGVSDNGVCSWSENDQIAVFDALSGKFYTFTTELGDGHFEFAGEPGVEYQFTHAFYPASAAASANSVTLPSNYSAPQIQAGPSFPMLGKVDGKNLLFRHLGALLKYTFTGIPSSADAIVISSPEVSLSGEFTVEGSGLDDGWIRGGGEDAGINEDVPLKSAVESAAEIHAAAGEGTVRIVLTPGEIRNLDFYVPLPIGAYSCSFDVKAGDAVLASYTTKTLKDVERAKLIFMRAMALGFSGGFGTEEDPFLISSAGDLQELSEAAASDERYRSAFYLQTADIDLSSIESFTPICSVDGPFAGTYDGAGHTISNLPVDFSGANAGLFGYLRGATVKDIYFSGANVSCSENYAGTVAGVLNGGTISGCRVDGSSTVTTSARGAGGIVGFVRSGTVRECASHASATASADIAGGIAGYLNTNADGNDILVINCTYEPIYNEGKIASAVLSTGAANAYMGGIAGSANCSNGLGRIRIANCYAYPFEMKSTQSSGTTVNYIGGIVGRIVSANVTVFNCLTPVTYSNVIIGGTRLDAKTYKNYTAAACISGTVSADGSTVRRVFSKNTWPVPYYSGKTVTTSDFTVKMGDSNMRGYGAVAFSTDYAVSGLRVYSEEQGGVLQALNDGVAAWNADNASAPALSWVYDPTFGYPKPSRVDVAGAVTKKISLIGDSISTYEGYIFSTDDSQMNKFYPDAGNSYANMVLNEQNTWWWQIIYGKMQNARLEVDNAFGGSTVSYVTAKIDGMAKDPNDRTQANSLQKRYLDYGLGNPDILFYHGGRNDFGQFGGNTDVLLGSYEDEALQAAYDASSGTLFGNYSQGTIAILKDFHTNHPSAKILMIVHDMMSDGFEDAAAAVAGFLSGKGFDIRVVNLHERGTNNKTNTTIGITKEGGTHPNIEGCTNMANYIFEQVGAWLEE